MVMRIVHTEGGNRCVILMIITICIQKIERFSHRKEIESNAIRMEQRFL